MLGGKRLFWAGGLAAFALVMALGVANQTSLKGWLFSQAMPPDYFSYYNTIKPSLYQVSGSVYAFEMGFHRSLVLRTSEGLAIIDTFGDEHVKAMQAALAEQFPGENVRWLVFSHNHLDHIRGSSLFKGVEVIGHTQLNQLIADWPNVSKGTAAVTRPLAGDQTLTLGGVEVQALYMPFSHSHTLYGFYVPTESVVFAADMMFVKAIPPFDFPDFYYPGYVRALDRLIAVNAKHYVPSHGWRGTRNDLIAYRKMTVDFKTTVENEVVARGIESPTDGPALRASLRAAYAKLHPEYGDWHGFDDMFIPRFGRHAGGAYLGY